MNYYEVDVILQKRTTSGPLGEKITKRFLEIASSEEEASNQASIEAGGVDGYSPIGIANTRFLDEVREDNS